MTPRKRAEHYVSMWDLKAGGGSLEDIVETAITTAVREEREACAKIADDHAKLCSRNHSFDAIVFVAASIRKRA